MTQFSLLTEMQLDDGYVWKILRNWLKWRLNQTYFTWENVEEYLCRYFWRLDLSKKCSWNKNPSLQPSVLHALSLVIIWL